jgi:hypothetical protein
VCLVGTLVGVPPLAITHHCSPFAPVAPCLLGSEYAAINNLCGRNDEVHAVVMWVGGQHTVVQQLAVEAQALAHSGTKGWDQQAAAHKQWQGEWGWLPSPSCLPHTQGASMTQRCTPPEMYLHKQRRAYQEQHNKTSDLASQMQLQTDPSNTARPSSTSEHNGVHFKHERGHLCRLTSKPPTPHCGSHAHTTHHTP